MRKELLIVILGLGTAVQAQKIDVKESNERFSSGSHNAYSANIYENKVEDVISAWKHELKRYKHEKVKDSDREVFGDNITIKDWGNNPVDFYTTFEENTKDKTIKMSVAVDLGGVYLSSSEKDKAKFVENMVKDFCLKMTKEPMEAAVKAAEKSLGKLEDNQKDLEKDNKNLKSDIENYKEKIKKAEEDVKKNEADQVKKKTEIEAQKKVTDELKKKLDKVN